MSLAIFDLDNTLLRGDSDHSWGEFLIEQGVVDGARFRRRNDEFYRDYLDGVLDIAAYVAFALAPVTAMSSAQRGQLRQRFMQEKIEAMVLPDAEALVERHRQQGDTLLIVTATNSFITAPIAARFGIDQLLATTPEQIDGQFTGRISGTPCLQEGKVTRVNEWLRDREETLADAWFYSDSANDIPLLNRVAKPVAVDPDDKLRAYAGDRGWPVISLR